jgi:hypothetical protein
MLNYDREDRGEDGTITAGHEYIEIGEDAKFSDKRSKEFSEQLLKDLPANIRDKIGKRKKGQRYIAVRRDFSYVVLWC